MFKDLPDRPAFEDSQTRYIKAVGKGAYTSDIGIAARCIVAPAPFANDTEAEAAIDALETEVMKEHPWAAQALPPRARGGATDCG